MLNLTYTLKPQKSAPDAILEIVRTKDTYLFDEVVIKNISHDGVNGVVLTYDYMRHGVKLQDLQPLYITPDNWAMARKSSNNDVAQFANTELVKRLFADGARQFNQRDIVAKADFLPDQDFIDAIKSFGQADPAAADPTTPTTPAAPASK